MDRELLREYCQAYVLGALEGTEREYVQRLIDRGDPACIEAIGEARELVSRFALLAPVIDPPPPLRARVIAAIEAEPAPATTPAAVPVVSIASRRRPNYAAWTGWAVAAGLLVALFLAGRQSKMLRDQFAAIQDRYTSQEAKLREVSVEAARNRRVLNILKARDARTIRLASTAPEAPQLRAYWSQPDGLVLVGSNVRQPQPGRTMQLWLVPKYGDPISAGTFQPDEWGEVVHIADSAAPPAITAALAISDEPAGGSRQPTTKPNWVGALSD
jgi:anti-sigma-K factor RskA